MKRLIPFVVMFMAISATADAQSPSSYDLYVTGLAGTYGGEADFENMGGFQVELRGRKVRPTIAVFYPNGFVSLGADYSLFSHLGGQLFSYVGADLATSSFDRFKLGVRAGAEVLLERVTLRTEARIHGTAPNAGVYLGLSVPLRKVQE